MVLAEFLTRKLLEPQRQRMRAEACAQINAEIAAFERGYAKGRAEAIAFVRARLAGRDINPDGIIPLEKFGKSGRS